MMMMSSDIINNTQGKCETNSNKFQLFKLSSTANILDRFDDVTIQWFAGSHRQYFTPSYESIIKNYAAITDPAKIQRAKTWASELFNWEELVKIMSFLKSRRSYKYFHISTVDCPANPGEPLQSKVLDNEHQGFIAYEPDNFCSLGLFLQGYYDLSTGTLSSKAKPAEEAAKLLIANGFHFSSVCFDHIPLSIEEGHIGHNFKYFYI